MANLVTPTAVERFIAPPGKKISLRHDFDPGFRPEGITKVEAKELLRAGIEHLAEYQEMLYAQRTHALLIILQSMDAAGKDGVIKHVMTGLNPQGCQVYSFRAPSEEDLDHDYLWRHLIKLPARGRIGIFNRSYYEEVLVVRVHSEFLERQRIPPELKRGNLWKRRFEDMNNLEQYLTANGIHVIKLFLHLSKEEQRKRFLRRIERPEKNWKFSLEDVRDRAHWDDYLDAYEDAISHTSTEWAPWHIVPADAKWFTRLAVSNIIYLKMKELKLRYPDVNDKQKEQLEKARLILQQEAGVE